MYPLLANLVLIVHLAFVVFVLCGGLLVLRWRWIAWLHVPAIAWGAFVEFSGWICPLTPLENWLRAQGGDISYRSDFIAQYLLPVLYPGDLTRDLQLLLGTVVIVLNAAVYWWLWQMQARGASRNQ
ncbi:MAG TPA: DUF2784 domain-containing protein [Nitrospiraceae bacterium]|jgi:hypothetical protein|nr:DUF2784 domain-containing protein [Nitrospiraceae bacterium]